MQVRGSRHGIVFGQLRMGRVAFDFQVLTRGLLAAFVAWLGARSSCLAQTREEYDRAGSGWFPNSSCATG